MLMVTREAEQAIETIVTQAGPPRVAGVRISAEHSRANGGNPIRDVRLAVIESPRLGDEAVEGAQVFLDPDAAALLDDKVLDAEIDAGQIEFSLHHRGAPA
jgi:iron-sulfur cluster assembly protein